MRKCLPEEEHVSKDRFQGGRQEPLCFGACAALPRARSVSWGPKKNNRGIDGILIPLRQRKRLVVPPSILWSGVQSGLEVRFLPIHRSSHGRGGDWKSHTAIARICFFLRVWSNFTGQLAYLLFLNILNVGLDSFMSSRTCQHASEGNHQVQLNCAPPCQPHRNLWGLKVWNRGTAETTLSTNCD